MEFIAKKSTSATLKTECAVVLCLNKKLLTNANQLDPMAVDIVEQQLKSKLFTNKTGTRSWITLPGSTSRKFEQLLVVNISTQEEKKKKLKPFDAEANRSLSRAIAGELVKSKVSNACVYTDNCLDDLDSELSYHDLAFELAIALSAKTYSFTLPDSKKSNTSAFKKLTVVTDSSAELKALKTGLTLGDAFGKGINCARNLGDLPGNVCTPNYLAETAKAMAAGSSKLSVKILNEKQMEKLGMHSFLSVSKGSKEEGKLICMEYKGKANSKAPHVLVGKGITFDTGGISLKPGSGMDEMKYDMCGAASVLGTMQALLTLDAKVHVVVVVAAAENMPNGNASKPGDIVTSMSGQTIEILNTDAEGRLVLCDALTYVERFKPKSVIDVATLTGACVVALGKHASAMYSNNDKLADSLLASSAATHDRIWQMPLWDDYQQQLHSNFADMANIGGPGGGSITAACFLARYAKKYHWAHLDIAGTAWLSGAKKGATGRPVSLLTHYLLNN